jgi:hypothetical protein
MEKALPRIEAPCSPPEADRESSKCKEVIPFYCSSLANPAARRRDFRSAPTSYGECARCCIFNSIIAFLCELSALFGSETYDF